MRLRALPACALLLVVAACGKAPSDTQCEQLRDHLIELEVLEAGGKPLTPDQQGQVVKLTQRQKFMSTCTDKTTRDLVECALAATSKDEVRGCDDPGATSCGKAAAKLAGDDKAKLGELTKACTSETWSWTYRHCVVESDDAAAATADCKK